MTLFSLTILRLGCLCSYFLVTLLALLTNTAILGMMGLKALSFERPGRSSG
jgi:hypothetical protein